MHASTRGCDATTEQHNGRVDRPEFKTKKTDPFALGGPGTPSHGGTLYKGGSPTALDRVVELNAGNFQLYRSPGLLLNRVTLNID
jgi:hypothetical protein